MDAVVVRRRRAPVSLVHAAPVADRVEVPKVTPNSFVESRDARIRRETRREFQEARRRFA